MLRRRSMVIPYIDPIDLRYRRFEPTPRPIAQAVMFCLMDVSGSMTEHMKDLAKRFFMLLYLFLKRRYEHVEVVFIRHTHEAKEVDEETFFHSRETGGTRVSTALDEMMRVVDGALSARQLEHLRRPGLRRRQRARRQRRDRRAPAQPRAAGLPVLRLHRSRREASRHPGQPAMSSTCGRTYENLGDEAPRHAARVHAPRHLSGVPRAFPAPRWRGGERLMAPSDACCSRAPTGTFDTIQRVHDAIEKIAVGEMGLDIYPNQIEVITAEQMLDAYSSIGMPLYLPALVVRQAASRSTKRSIARAIGPRLRDRHQLEPCITYIMEENTMTMQTLVIAHAAFGHNHFFKNNYLFQQWTDAERHPRLSRLRARITSRSARSATASRQSSACSTRRTR